MPQDPARESVARVLQVLSPHDPYCLVFGPDNPDAPGSYLLRIMLAVPEDRPSGHHWRARTLEEARALLPTSLARWPKERTTPKPGLVEQWCLGW